MMLPLIRVLLIGAISVLLVAGCANGTGDLEDWVDEVRDRPPEPIEPIPPIRSPEVVAYEGADLPDPFHARGRRSEDDEVAAGDETGLRPDPDRRREYLEEFPLDTLAMVGTLEINDVEHALVRDNENVVHRVREGNYMGRNHGKVLEVQSDSIELRELVQDGRGGWMERRTRIAMAEQ